MSGFGIGSYATAALAYGAATAVLVANHPGGRNASWIIASTTVSALWAAALAVVLIVGDASFPLVAALDSTHSLVWLGCALSWLAPASGGIKPRARLLLAASSVAFGAWAIVAGIAFSPDSSGGATAFPAMLGIALLGLLVVEQVYRNAREEQRRRLRLLCLSAGAVFVVDVFVYSQATLLGGPAPFVWAGRGLLNAMLAPVILVAVKRQSEWERELFVSRQVAFYTATLVAVGTYLLLMGAAAYVIRAFGGEWGPLLESVFLVLAFAVLALVLYSGYVRARVKVFIVKHFYRNKYDYREEWLRLTESLGTTAEPRPLAASALEGIARIIGTREGSLWLEGQGSRYERFACLGLEDASVSTFERDHPIVEFLAAKKWVIDSQEYAVEPDLYENAFGDPSGGGLPPDSIIVPLDCQGHLLGFVVLAKPSEIASLNFEDHDILKTAGRQIAVVLAQALAQQQLTATRQFEAMNKLAAFLMHDLKNVVAQQELVVANFQRFRHRPEFIDDAMTTIRSSVERMRRVLEQLQGTARQGSGQSRVDVSKVVMEVRSHCADREPVPQIDLSAGRAVTVAMDREKLVSVLTHLVRNAQDATPPDGRIVIEVGEKDGRVCIGVSDTGKGMDAAFVRDRLFRPFDTTKGVKGMGIGAYQVRDIVRAAGGEVDVRSKPGVGTTFRVTLPAVTHDQSMLKQPAA